MAACNADLAGVLFLLTHHHSVRVISATSMLGSPPTGADGLQKGLARGVPTASFRTTRATKRLSDTHIAKGVADLFENNHACVLLVTLCVRTMVRG